MLYYTTVVKMEIRLISLHPAFPPKDSGQKIQCDICFTTLVEAVSYTWGNPEDLRIIHTSGTEFKTRRNLQSTLLHLRFQHEARMLSIKAISLYIYQHRMRYCGRTRGLDLCFQKGFSYSLISVHPSSRDRDFCWQNPLCLQTFCSLLSLLFRKPGMIETTGMKRAPRSRSC